MVALQWTCLASPSFASTNKGHSVPMKNERQMDNLLFRRGLNIRLGVAFEDRPGLCEYKTRSLTAGAKDMHDSVVHVLSSSCQHSKKCFTFSKHGELRTPTEVNGKNPDEFHSRIEQKATVF